LILKVQLPGTLEATHTSPEAAFDVEPIVYRADGKPVCMYLSVFTASGKQISQCALAVSGATGEVCLLKRKPTIALIDREPGDPVEEIEPEEEGDDDAS